MKRPEHSFGSITLVPDNHPFFRMRERRHGASMAVLDPLKTFHLRGNAVGCSLRGGPNQKCPDLPLLGERRRARTIMHAIEY